MDSEPLANISLDKASLDAMQEEDFNEIHDNLQSPNSSKGYAERGRQINTDTAPTEGGDNDGDEEESMETALAEGGENNAAEKIESDEKFPMLLENENGSETEENSGAESETCETVPELLEIEGRTDTDEENIGGADLQKESQSAIYDKLVELDNVDLVQNMEPFSCPVCLMEQKVGEGVVLKGCLHIFCKNCLIQAVEMSERAEICCPFRDDTYSCAIAITQNEIKALVTSDVFESYLGRSLAQAEHQAGNAFHCKTPDCKGWCILEADVSIFHCPVCDSFNCLSCQAIHHGLSCQTYQEHLKLPHYTGTPYETTPALEVLIDRGEAMACPTCKALVTKEDGGCDWVMCALCSTEICWITKGPRWGPAGKGDTSAGCRCQINGKCHEDCQYCH